MTTTEGIDPTEAARLVRELPDEALRELLRGEARRAVLDEVFRRMPEYVDSARARGMNAVFGWKITGAADGGSDRYRVVIADGEVRAGREIDAQPQLTLVLDGVEFLKLVTGNSNPVMAFMTGKLKLKGDVAFAARLPGLFRIPSAGGDG
jgi:putative sterol carrier protein